MFLMLQERAVEDKPAAQKEAVYRLTSITPPARGATLPSSEVLTILAISIHAPRKGGDLFGCTFRLVIQNFNPRPLRGGRLHGRRILL